MNIETEQKILPYFRYQNKTCPKCKEFRNFKSYYNGKHQLLFDYQVCNVCNFKLYFDEFKKLMAIAVCKKEAEEKELLKQKLTVKSI